ncbi:TetR/AcrR family transcriptional regulator C-terminal domain-containing protein [Rugosimonospora africana]|uniref:TetR family transcriptional regulator n=1 Tax=Rugosimonospora africana TaxID=556532 RepID=A0A8J3QXN2_9ACTN|nr:TetR/AcrR family transcriptional regulator C-terminal domain-containing protein [Rugosimonospora africana]GIH17723.1 TetR family transcriptional regulator [Rugosimonospora africana]
MPPLPLPSPPTRRTLNREYLATAALALIDAEGLRKFSMRRLGAVLGVDPMAAYRHFEDQEALFDGIAEALFDELDVDSLPWEAPWRELATQYCRRLREVLLRHPHAVSVFATRPVRSPASIEMGVHAVAKLRDAGIPPATALRVLRCVREFTVGHALSVSTLALGVQRRSKKPEKGSPRYNLLAQAADETAPDDHFETGLQAMLRGFEQP